MDSQNPDYKYLSSTRFHNIPFIITSPDVLCNTKSVEPCTFPTNNSFYDRPSSRASCSPSSLDPGSPYTHGEVPPLTPTYSLPGDLSPSTPAFSHGGSFPSTPSPSTHSVGDFWTLSDHLPFNGSLECEPMSWADDVQPSSIQLQPQYAIQNQNYYDTQHVSQVQMLQVQQHQQSQTHIQSQPMMPPQLQLENQQQQYVNQNQQPPTNHQSQQHLTLPQQQAENQRVQQYQQPKTHVQNRPVIPPQLQLENQQQQYVNQNQQPPTNHLILPQQQIEDQQFQSHHQPAYTNLATQDVIFVQATIESIELENIQTEVNVSRGSNLKRARSDASTLNSKGDDKRSRNAITLQGKVEIINFRKQNPSVSMQELSRITGVPRSTIYGIFENSEKIINLSRIQPNMSRAIENRFRTLEIVLLGWILNVEDRGIKATNKKICAQAFETHRMLSGLVKDPLPQCLFTTGWLKGFKERRAAHLTKLSSTQEQPQHDKIKDILGELAAYSKDDIYTCGITSMYLDMMPTSVYKSDDPNKPPRRTDSSSVSILLCCNATGKDMLDPVVLVRQTSNVVGLQGSNGVVLDSNLNNMTSRVVRSWLTKFDNDVERKVVLLVDQAMYDLFELDKVCGKNLLRFVTVLCVPRCLTPFLPMNANIIKSFKVYYYILLLKATWEWLQHLETRRVSEESHSSLVKNSVGSSRLPPLNTIVSRLRIIPNAWLQVSTSTIESDFQYFLRVSEDLVSRGQLRSNHPLEEVITPESTLKEMLATVYPNLPGSVIQYYLTQSNEIGPCCFLRSQILAMQSSEDFRGSFGDSIDFGTVRYGSRKLESGIRFENAKQKVMILGQSGLPEKRSPPIYGPSSRHTQVQSSDVITYGPSPGRMSTFFL